MVAQDHDYNKNHWIVSFKMRILCYVSSISVKKKNCQKRVEKQRIPSDYNQKKKWDWRRNRRDLRHTFSPHRCWFEEGVDSVTKNVGGRKELKEGPRWQPARSQGPQHYNLKELNSTDNLPERPEVGSSLKPQRGMSPCCTFTPAFTVGL